MKYITRKFPLFALLTIFWAGCDFNGDNSLFNEENLGSDPDPTVTSITSVESPPFAGIDVISIKGSNFSSDPTKNMVYVTFYLPAVDAAGNIISTGGKPDRGKVRDAIRATVLTASATELTIRAPIRPTFDPKDPKTRPLEEVDIRVATLGAENFSATSKVLIAPSFEPVNTFDAKTEEPFGMTNDKANNIYVSLFVSGSAAGVFTYAPDGTRSQFLTAANVQSQKFDDMQYRDDEGYLYAVRGLRAVFRFKKNSNQETHVAIPTTLESARLVTLDFDANNNLWVGGNNANLYRVKPDKTTKNYAFVGDVRSIRVSGTNLFVLAKKDNQFSVFRFPIDGNSDLGTPVKVTDLNLGTNEAFAIDLAKNGDIFVATNRNPDPLLLISNGQVSTLYPGTFIGMARSFAWGADPILYVGQGVLPLGTSTSIAANFLMMNTRKQGVR